MFDNHLITYELIRFCDIAVPPIAVASTSACPVTWPNRTQWRASKDQKGSHHNYSLQKRQNNHEENKIKNKNAVKYAYDLTVFIYTT